MAGTFTPPKSTTISGLPEEHIADASELADRSDEELIAAYQQGLEEAFDVLVSRFKDPLTNFVYRFLGDFDECDDVVQETFVRVFRNKHLYKPQAKFSTWIYTIAANLAKTRLRQQERRRTLSFSPMWRKEDDQRDYDIPDTRYAADRDAESALTNERIQKALNAISAKYREVVILRDIQELSYEEIVEVTGLKIGTVKSRINRGRAMLQKLLKDVFEE